MKSTFLFDVNEKIENSLDFVHVSCLPFLLGEDLGKLKRFNAKKVLVSLPFISKGNSYVKFGEKFPDLAKVADGFTVENIGDYYFLLELFNKNKLDRGKYYLSGDYALNITNNESAMFWKSKLDSVALLPELSLEKQMEIAKSFPVGLIPEIINSEDIIVGRSEHCFAVTGKQYNCGACGKYGLDGKSFFNEKKEKFRVVTNRLDCNSIILGKNPNIGQNHFGSDWIVRV